MELSVLRLVRKDVGFDDDDSCWHHYEDVCCLSSPIRMIISFM